MTPERFRQIEELYHAAREGTAEERAALLARPIPNCAAKWSRCSHRTGGGEFLDRPAHPRTPGTAGGCDCRPDWLRALAWDPTVSKASSARAAWARSFGRSTRD